MIDRISLKKIIAYMRGFLLKRRVKTTGPIKVYGKIKIKNPRGKITIGQRSKLFPGVTFDFEAAPPGSNPEIIIGDFVHIGDRTEIHCGSKVTIGYRAGISWDVLIMGSDYHSDSKGDAVPQAIVIEDLAWIYARATILKGVTIGKGAVVGACSVVTKDVPPYTVVAGNPARVIRTIDPKSLDYLKKESDGAQG